MFDWKVLAGLPAAGAIAGYIGSLFSDPIRKEIGDRKLRRLIRKSLYREIASNYCGLIMFLDPARLSVLEHRFAHNMRDYAHTSAFDYAKTQQSVVFGMREWTVIEQIYKSLKKIIDKPAAGLPDIALLGTSYASIPGKNLISLIEETAISGTLSIRLFSKVMPDISDRLKEIKSGKRRKSSDIYAEIDKKANDEFIELMNQGGPPPPPPMPG